MITSLRRSSPSVIASRVTGFLPWVLRHSREKLSLNVPDCLGTMSRVSHHLAVLFHEYSSRTSSARTRIRTPTCCEPGRGWLIHRGKESWYVLCCLRLVLLLYLLPGYLFCSEIMPPHHDLKLMLVNTLRKVYTVAVEQDVSSQASLGSRG